MRSSDDRLEHSVIYRFTDVVVEPATFRLLKAGEPVHIEPKALEVLIYLIERRDRIVTKQELLDEVWKGIAVTENALARAIAQIRKTIDDDRPIQTVHGRGYRFVADLRGDPAVPVAAVPSTPLKKGSRTPLLIAVLVVLFAIVVGFFTVLVARKSMPRRDDKLEPVTSRPIAGRPLAPSPRVQSFPTFSPDPSIIAYSADVDGTPHIFTMGTGGGEETQLTRGDGETQPAWSPDGKSIAYVSARHGGIWLVPARGGEATQLTRAGSRPAWSPDSAEIAFQTGDQIDYGWTAYEALPPSAISIVNVGTRNVTSLTRAGRPAGGHAAPSWRNDGRRLVFSSCEIERCTLYTIARDGSALTSIVTDSRRLFSPVFEPDGRWVDYVLARYTDSVLLALPVNSDGQRIANPARLRVSDRGVMQHVAISRDGFRRAWTLIEDASDLVSIRLDGGAPVPVTRNTTLRSMYPAFSPDGSKIAFCAAAAGDDSGLWIAGSDGKNPKAVAVGPGLKQHTSWSRGGWDVYYSAWYEPGPALFDSSLITGRTTIVAQLPHDASGPMLSPDGAAVAFNRTIDGVTTVWIDAVGSVGGGSRRLTSNADLARFPVWSPLGKLIAVQVRRPDGSAVGVIPPRGGKLRIITTEPGESWPYGWSPDEKQIAFAGRRDGVWNIWIVPVDGGTPRRLTMNESTTTWMRSPAWSPLGAQIVYESGTPKANLWVSEAVGKP